MSNAPAESTPTVVPWRVVFGGRFWLNYAVCLLITLWMPLTELKVVVEGVQQGPSKTIPLYSVYGDLFEGNVGRAVLQAILLHWGITFFVMALVWWLLLRVLPARRATTGESKSHVDPS